MPVVKSISYTPPLCIEDREPILDIQPLRLESYPQQINFNAQKAALLRASMHGCGDDFGAIEGSFMNLYCCGCLQDVSARLTNGKEIYPHRADLHNLPFWKCDACGNYVGCHHKTKNRTAPLGCIPNPELKNARKHIHAILDPIWQSGHVERKALYAEISSRVGWKYHTAKIRSIEEAREVYKTVRDYSNSIQRTA